MDTQTASDQAKEAAAAPRCGNQSLTAAVSSPASSVLNGLKSSDLRKGLGDQVSSGASSLNRGAMDQWLSQNATTFSPAGYRSQIQPKVELPMPVQMDASGSMVRTAFSVFRSHASQPHRSLLQ